MKAYLAGDLIFRPNAIALLDRLKEVCAQNGLEGVSPFDGQAEVKDLPPGRDQLLTIVRADRSLMQTCDTGLFCVDPFRRAPDMDAGTAVEIGYMHALNKPMEGYTIDGRNYPEKVAAYWDEAFKGELRQRLGPNELGSGSLEDPDGILAHSDGMVQNCMVEGFINLSGGQVSTGEDLETAFAKAAKRLAARAGEYQQLT